MTGTSWTATDAALHARWKTAGSASEGACTGATAARKGAAMASIKGGTSATTGIRKMGTDAQRGVRLSTGTSALTLGRKSLYAHRYAETDLLFDLKNAMTGI